MLLPERKNVFPLSFLNKLIEALPTFSYSFNEPFTHYFYHPGGLAVTVCNPVTLDEHSSNQPSKVVIGNRPVMEVLVDCETDFEDEDEAYEQVLEKFYDAAIKIQKRIDAEVFKEDLSVRQKADNLQKSRIQDLEALYIKAVRKPAKHGHTLSSILFEAIFENMEKNSEYVCLNAKDNPLSLTILDDHGTALTIYVDVFDFYKSRMSINGVDTAYMYMPQYENTVHEGHYFDMIEKVYKVINRKLNAESVSLNDADLICWNDRLGFNFK